MRIKWSIVVGALSVVLAIAIEVAVAAVASPCVGTFFRVVGQCR